MTEANWTQLIAMCGAVAVPGIVSCYLGWLSLKKSQLAAMTAGAAAVASKSNGENIERLRQAVDGRFSELLSSTAGRAKLEGFLEGGVAEAAKAAAVATDARENVALADSKTVATAHALLVTAAEAAREVLARAEAVAAGIPRLQPGSLEAKLSENIAATVANTAKMPEPLLGEPDPDLSGIRRS